MTLCLGASVSLSSDGRVLAVGGIKDDHFTGATWIFVSDGGAFQQLGDKLLGNDASGNPIFQGKEGTRCQSYVIGRRSTIMFV